jgi:hypothetical protein
MTRAERAEVLKALTVLQNYHRIEPLSEALQLVYLEAFDGYPVRDVLTALKQSIQVHTWFPKVPEITQLIDGSDKDRSLLAWNDLVREIRRTGYTGRPHLPDATLDAVDRVWGSWVTLCQTLPAEGPGLSSWEKRFRETYAVLATRERMALSESPSRPQLVSSPVRAVGGDTP